MIKDASLVEVDCMRRLQHDDDSALATLMNIFYDNLFHYASRFCCDESMAKDCIQEVFISLWQRRSTAASILSPRYYLLRAVKNKILKALHYQASRPVAGSNGPSYDFLYELSAEQQIINKEVSNEKVARLHNTFSCLTIRQKEIIYLKFYQRLDNGQIAELMNISRQSVYNLLHETIQKLRGILECDYLFT